jgi:hypothetical protein
MRVGVSQSKQSNPRMDLNMHKLYMHGIVQAKASVVNYFRILMFTA